MFATIIVAFEYYKQIRRAQKEYEKARDFIEDIVLSFNRDLKRETKRFESMSSKVEESYVKSNAISNKTENFEKRINPIEEQISNLSRLYETISQKISEDITENSQDKIKILSNLTGLETKLKDIEATQETLINKITGFEEQIQKILVSPQTQEIRGEISVPPIIIKKDKALAALTDTEIAVLEMLIKDGPKTAPEIKEKINLSREHTARLMKKLYEEGYLERGSGKIPFIYSIKKEMETLLQKSESPTM